MGDLFGGYQLGSGWDEVLAAPDAPHEAARTLYDALSRLSAADLADRSAALARAFRDQGVTFSLSGEERPFPLDLIPRIVAAEEWRLVERGVIQRLLALEALLADLAGEQQVLAEGVLPRRVVVSSTAYTRAAHGIKPANGVRIHVSGIDVVRDGDGVLRVLEDNLRTPSGVSYVLENRRATALVLPELLSAHRVRPVAEYPARLLAALRAAAPAGVNEPVVVVLTPGVYNAAYFEHSLLARTMGVQLVEGRDLECRDDFLWMRTTAGRQRVDVLYRRVDDEFLDPLHFRADSIVGCPGLLNVARRGHVAIANAVGNGVADDKLLYTYVPDLIRYYLAEEPILPNVDTFRLEDPDVLDYVLDRLADLVLKPVDGSGGRGITIGPHATAGELAQLSATVRADPRGWIAQPVVQLSTCPTQAEDRLAPRHVDLRPFAVNDGERVWVLPGGLTRVALPAGSLVVNSSQGGGSKDTWVLADEEIWTDAPTGPRIPQLPLTGRGLLPEAGPAYQDQQ